MKHYVKLGFNVRAVYRRPVNAEPQHRSQAASYRISDRQSDTGLDLCLSLSVFLWHGQIFILKIIIIIQVWQKELHYLRANKFKTKEDTANVFLFLESTQNAALHQRVLNKSSLKWRPWILIHWCSLSVVVHDLDNHFRCNGSNFLSYRLLQSFQSLSCFSKV